MVNFVVARVLFLSIFNPFGPNDSGIGHHIRNLSEELTKLGCEIHIVLPSKKNDITDVNKVIVHSFKSPLFNSVGGDLAFSLFSTAFVNHICDEYKIDVVHGQSPSSFGYALMGKTKKPFVVTLHGASFGEIRSYNSVSLSDLNLGLLKDAMVIQPMEAFLTNIEYKKADKVIAVSKYLADEAKNFYRIKSERIVSIHNGVNLLPFSNSVEYGNSSHVILCVCRLVWRKGVMYLIYAMQQILKEYADAQLIIVGTGEQLTSLKNKVTVLGIENSVHFLGYVSRQQLFSLYAQADVYIQPSLYEPLGIAILEAMSFGKPVIASRVGGIPEMVTNGVEGLLVEPGNIRQLSESVKKIFSDTSLKKRCGTSARMKVKTDFSWLNIAKKTLAVYEDLLI